MGDRVSGRRARVGLLLVPFLFVLAAQGLAHGAVLPVGFAEQLVAEGLTAATAMQIAPDGRIFVTLQAGQIRVIENGTLLPTPFATIPVAPTTGTERGLLGIAFDPNFAVNQHVYIYYTATTPTVHNRISRLTASGNVAVPNSEVALVDLETLGPTNHNGGALNFGPDGKLYAAVGENAVPANAQSFSNRLGKILRYNTDGSIPADNPYFNDAAVAGLNKAIWALGLRNPYTFAFNPGGVGPAMFINDVGQNTFEEVNEGVPRGNYGWPDTEGDFPPSQYPNYVRPSYAYEHSNGECAITGGAFYAPTVQMFPADYRSDYFFADFCAGWIRRLDPSLPSADASRVIPFASGLGFPVDLKVAADGSLYYLQRGGGGRLFRVVATTPPPVAPPAPMGLTGYTNGLTLNVSWGAAAGAEGYILEAGSNQGAADIFSGNLGTLTAIEAVVPARTYFIRVRAVNAFGTGPASAEIEVTVTGSGTCATPPPVPSWFNAQGSGLLARLSWDASPSATGYVLEAGSASGLTDLLRSNMGKVTTLTATAPAGTYFVRVRAANACGESAPSVEVPVTLGCTPPPAGPTGLTSAIANGVLTLQWSGTFGHTGYRLEVGSQPGTANIFVADLGTAAVFHAPLDNVPAGTYYVRLRAFTTCGVTAPSNEVTLTVP